MTEAQIVGLTQSYDLCYAGLVACAFLSTGLTLAALRLSGSLDFHKGDDWYFGSFVTIHLSITYLLLAGSAFSFFEAAGRFNLVLLQNDFEVTLVNAANFYASLGGALLLLASIVGLALPALVSVGTRFRRSP